jgi:hypothetical protein
MYGLRDSRDFKNIFLASVMTSSWMTDDIVGIVVAKVALGQVLLSVLELPHQYHSISAPYLIHLPLAIYNPSS